MPDRFIRESALTSESLSRLSDFAERLFWRLTTIADDFGRFNANPAVVAGRAMPLVNGATPKKVESLLLELHANGSIQLYEAAGGRFGYFPSWEKHQITRARVSKHPEPPKATLVEHPLPLESDIEDLIFEAIVNGHLEIGSNQIAERQVRRGENYFDILVRTSNATFIFELKRGRLSNKATGQLRRYMDAVPESIGILVGNGLAADFDLSACADDIAVVTYDDALQWTLRKEALGLPATLISQFPNVKSRELTLDKVCAAPNTHTDDLDSSLSSPDPESSLDPNRSLETGRKPKRETVWPDGFALTPAMREYATSRGIDPDREFEAFHDWAISKSKRYVDWEAGWRTRINNAPRYGGAVIPAARASPAGNGPNFGNSGMANLARHLENAANGSRRNGETAHPGQRELVPPADRRPDDSGMASDSGRRGSA